MQLKFCWKWHITGHIDKVVISLSTMSPTGFGDHVKLSYWFWSHSCSSENKFSCYALKAKYLVFCTHLQAQDGSVVLWLTLLPHSKNTLGLIPGWGSAFLCGVCMTLRASSYTRHKAGMLVTQASLLSYIQCRYHFFHVCRIANASALPHCAH